MLHSSFHFSHQAFVRHALLVTALLLPVGAFAQSRITAGFIVENRGDTTQGRLEELGSTLSAKKCEFSPAGQSKMKEYTPDDIRAYGDWNNQLYVSKEVELDSLRQRVFLMALFLGRVNIYYTYAGGYDHYFIEKDTAVYELKNTQIVQTTSGRYADHRFSFYKKEYIGILTVLMQDGLSTNEISSAALTQLSLVRLARKYQQAVTNRKPVFMIQQSKTGPIIGLIGAVILFFVLFYA